MPKSNAKIGASEDHRTEWKETWRDEYLKTLCAFANGEGGRLEVGRNDKGEAVGVSDAKKLLEDLPNKARDVLGIMIEVRLVREGRRALVALTAPSYPHPVSYRGRYYVRSGSTTQELRGAALDRFLLQKQGRTWDGVPLPELEESDLSQAALERFRKLAGASGRLPKADLQAKLPALIDKLKLRDGVYLKRAAALLFHEDPERFVTGAFVKIGFFRSESDLVYHDEIHGDLFAQVERSIDLILTKYFKAAITYDGIQRVESYPVPEAALREALLNAVVHRDYAIPAPIQIRIYHDHMKLWNPAMLPDGWDLKRLLGEHASHPFNPDLANTFFRAGEIETWGRGIHRIFAACKAAAAPKPEVRYEPNDLWFEFSFSDRYLAAIEGASEPTGGIRKRQGTTQELTQKLPKKLPKKKILALMRRAPGDHAKSTRSTARAQPERSQIPPRPTEESRRDSPCRGYQVGSLGGIEMNPMGKPERATQNRVIALFREDLGYAYLGNWIDREGNSNIEVGLIEKASVKRGYTAEQINRNMNQLQRDAEKQGRSLYHTNQAVYERLRYGVPVKVEAGRVTETVHLVDWESVENNDFAIAEEVTLKGNHERRPDLVFSFNGIAVGVIELKNSRVSIGDGIRQLISNQKPEFNEWFFATVQLVFAGNDSEGLQYGTTETPEKYFLKWKEDEDDDSGYKLDKYLTKMCAKERLLELLHDFILFDGGTKKVPRVHQYFGIKAAQDHVHRREGGIIWHTQGSGKSIVMVLLAKWILENNPNARVAVITDRDELDKQIADVLKEAGVVSPEEKIRASSGRDLMAKLGEAKPRLVCSLVHKFGQRRVKDFEAFIKDLESQPSKTVGEVFVFVDECHRTQSGKLHRAMKAIMPNAIFMGFTGTPLLKRDKQTTLEVFGRYIHTYKFSEAVDDDVILDLVYEARDIDQKLGSQDKIDAWFEAKTKALNNWQKDELKKKWGTMQKVLSARSRMDRVVSDILFDFSVKPRLSGERGNAILVASSIFEACKYFTLFRKTPLKNKCAVVTSYNPLARDISKEDTGEDSETDKEFIYATYAELLKDVNPSSGKTKTETYEDNAKKQFKEEPNRMKLLVVVDKLLTGFDAPPCTYLYIDKSMQDHGLFQAICRTNRLDGDDKEFGYIVDYKDLFTKVENAIAVYTSELDDSAGGADPNILLKDRLKKGKERLDDAFEKLDLLCEPVEPPKGDLEHIHYFCGNTEKPSDLQEREPQRSALYKGTATLMRAYASLADEFGPAGYSPAECNYMKAQLDHYLGVRDIIRKASGETLDLKPYEADMRHLIDTYVEAEDSRVISPFDGLTLTELIVKSGIADAITEKLGRLKGNKDAIAETIENNVRRKIIKEQINDPAFYEKMSALLDEIIAARKAKALEYEDYLKQVAALVARTEAGHDDDTPEVLKRSAALRALFNNLDTVADDSNQRLDLATRIDGAVREVRPDGFRGNQAKENVIKRALLPLLGNDVDEVERVFEIIRQQREY